MKTIAVIPGRPNSIHLAELPMPRVEDVPGGRGVLVKVLRVGVDGTDKEINAASHVLERDEVERLAGLGERFAGARDDAADRDMLAIRFLLEMADLERENLEILRDLDLEISREGALHNGTKCPTLVP